MARRRKSKRGNITGLIVIVAIIFTIGFVYHYVNYHGEDNFWSFIGTFKEVNGENKGNKENNENNENNIVTDSEMSIHFLELGNKYNGDSIYIKAGDTDILIDAGSKKSSSTTISNYINNYVTDGKLEYVIATHAHEDHIAAFVGSSSDPGIFSLYEIGTLIDFPLTNSTSKLYGDYQTLREEEIAEGTAHYTALECYKNINGAKRTYELANGITMSILYNYFYEHSSSSENNYSVCVLINQGSKNYLFTGDLEETGENKLVEYNVLPEVDLFKAPHHGSSTSSGELLLSVIKPKIVVVQANCGYDQYKASTENIFPSQKFVTNTGRYTDKIYITTLTSTNEEGYIPMNGTVVITINSNAITNNLELEVNGSNNNTLFKDTSWCQENRIWP